MFLLQIGVFDENNNAKQISNDMILQGCSGYILEKDQKYRVFLSGYSNKDDAENVKNRLLTEYEIDTKVFELSNNSIEVTIEGNDNLLMEVDDSVKKMLYFPDELIKISQNFDKKLLEYDEVKDDINKLKKVAEEYENKTLKIFDECNDKYINEIYNYYTSIHKYLLLPEDEISDIELSSFLKTLYIEVSLKYNDFLSAVSA